MNPRLLPALLLLLSNTLLAQVKISSKEVQVLAATKEGWSPGTVRDNNSVGGMMYQITAEIRKSGNYVFDSLVSLSGSLPVEVIKSTTRGYKGPLKKGDRVTFIAYQTRGDTFYKSSNAVHLAVTRQKAAVSYISYRLAGRRCLAPVPEFQKKTSEESNQ